MTVANATFTGLNNSNISNSVGDYFKDYASGWDKIADAVKSGIGYVKNKKENKAETERVKLEALAAQYGAGYGALNKDGSTDILLNSFQAMYNKPVETQAKADNNKIIWLALITGAALVAVFFYIKMGK